MSDTTVKEKIEAILAQKREWLVDAEAEVEEAERAYKGIMKTHDFVSEMFGTDRKEWDEVATQIVRKTSDQKIKAHSKLTQRRCAVRDLIEDIFHWEEHLRLAQ